MTSQEPTSKSRRRYLKLAGAVAATPSFIGAASASTGGMARRRSNLADEFSTVIDAREAGADDEGEEPITGLLEDLVGEDTLLRFPRGRYRMSRHLRHTNFDKFGMVGDNAVFVPDDYEDFDDNNGSYWLFRLGTPEDPGGTIHVENVQVDQTASQTGVRAFDLVASESLRVDDVDIHGTDDLGSEGPLRVGITDTDGTGTVEKFWAEDGALMPDQVPNQDDLYMWTTGVVANYPNKGTLTFDDCRIFGFPGTGLYATSGDGQYKVRGGWYKNNGVAQLRVGGNDSVVRDADVAVTERHPDYPNQRGIRIEDASGWTVVDGVDVYVTEPNGSALYTASDVEYLFVTGLDLMAWTDEPMTGVAFTDAVEQPYLVDSNINLNAPAGYAVWIEEAPYDGDPGIQRTTIEGDTGTDNGGFSGIRNERDGTELRQVEVDQTSDDHYRKAVENVGDDVLYYDSSFRAEYHPIVEHGSGAWIEGNYSNSYGGKEAILLADDSHDVLVKENTLVDGVANYGAYDVRAWENDYSG